MDERSVVFMEDKIRIIMYSSADKVDGQGVGSAYEEQVNLIKEGASDIFEVGINNWIKTPDIQHFHKSADRLVVVNPSFIDALVEYGIDRERIYYIPNYVSKEKFYRKSDEACAAIRKKYGVAKDAFVVLGAGQVQTRKGVLDFVNVAKQMPDVQFVWAGGFSFGRITDGYEELKKLQENPPENCKFLGIVPREEMVDLYNMANVLFVPSYNELFPMTILEAVNLHVPLVLRDLDLYKDILFDRYMHADDNEGFKNCLLKLKNDSDVYAKYQNESRLLSEFYSKEHVLNMWREFYLSAYKDKQEELLNKKK